MDNVVASEIVNIGHHVARRTLRAIDGDPDERANHDIARALKCTIVLDPAKVAEIVAPDGKPRTVIAIRLPDRRVSADLNAKSVRKAVATISEHGPDGVAVIIQGKLVGDAITEAGIVAQPAQAAEAAA